MNGLPVALRGTGSAVPSRRVTTAEIASLISAQSGEAIDEEWILERSGIQARYLSNSANESERTSGLAAKAGLLALENAGFPPESIDHVIVATCTSDSFFPSTACRVAEALKIPRANCVDLNAACTGFLTALSAARAWLSLGMGKRALVIGADVLSPYLNWGDRTTCPLFGDGAGAVVLEQSGEGAGIFAMELGSIPEEIGLFELSPMGTGARTLTMSGPEAFRSAVRTLTHLCKKTLERSGVSPEEIDLVIPHQANLRILEAVAKRTEISMDRFATSIRDVGNTSAASIPAALDHSLRSGRLKPGGLALLCAYGAGITYGSCLLRVPAQMKAVQA